LKKIRNHYLGALARGDTENQDGTTTLADKARTLISRFRRFEDMILRFTTDLSVPFTNNAAERARRPVKIQQRTSGGCWRTLQGLTDFAIVQSYLDTATKWGLDKLNALHQLFTTGAWLPPALSPADAMKGRGLRSSWVVPRRMLGVLTSITTKEAPDGSLRRSASGGDGSASTPVGVGADDPGRGEAGHGADRE
jgi:hypothetical protein